LEAVLPPSSGIKFVIKEMCTLHCCLPNDVPGAQFKVFMAEKYKQWFSGILHHIVRWLETNVLEVMLPPISRVEVCDRKDVSTTMLPTQRSY
jgi:hypothetical protein